MPLVDQKEKWWVTVMGVGLDSELSKMIRALGSSYWPNWEGILLHLRIPLESGHNQKRMGQCTNNQIPADSYWLPSVTVMVVWHDFRLTLFFYFAKSNSSYTLVDLISSLILSIHMTLILSLPISSLPLLHILYLSLKYTGYSMMTYRTQERRLSTRT